MKIYKFCVYEKNKFIINLQVKHGGAIDYSCYSW